MPSADIDISQKIILTKMAKYFQLLEDSGKEKFFSQMKNLNGHCSAFSLLALIGKNLEEQPQRVDAKGNVIPRDDWTWLEKTYKKLSQWQGKLIDLSQEDRADIERLYYHIEYFQHSLSYLPIPQGDLHILAQFDDPTKKFNLNYSLAGLFTADDFTKTININGKNMTMFDELFKENTDIFIGSHNHALALRVRNDCYYFYDANYKSGWRAYEANQKKQLINDIFAAYLVFDPDKPSPFEIRVFSKNQAKPENYPAQAALLAALDSAIEPVALDYAENTSALHMAAFGCCDESLAYYLSKNVNANVNNVTENGSTPLYVAAQNGRLNAVVQLLKSGAGVNGNDKKPMTPLFMAAQGDHFDIVKILTENGADISKKTDDNLSPLGIAVSKNHIEIVKYLIQKLKERTQHDPALFQEMLKETLVIAITDGAMPAIVDIILDNITENVNDIKLNRKSIIDTPLSLAADFGKTALVELFIGRGANVNLATNDKTPLHKAARMGYLEIVNVLIKNGADVNARPTGPYGEGETPIISAIRGDHLDVAKVLIKHNANLFTEFSDSSSSGLLTPMKMAAECSNVAILAAMFENNKLVQLEHLITVLDMLGSSQLSNCNRLMNMLQSKFITNLFIDENKLQFDKFDSYIRVPDSSSNNITTNSEYKNEIYKLLLLSALESYRYQVWQQETGSTGIFIKTNSPRILAADALLNAMEGRLDKQTLLQQHYTELTSGDLGEIYKRWESIGQALTKGYKR